MKRKLLWLLGIILTVALVISGYRTVAILAEYAQAEEAQQQVIDSAVTIADEALPAAAVKTAETPVTQTLPLETPPIAIDFDALSKTNPDIVGWLYSAGTKINYPVVQTDNNTYYLNHLYDGKKGSSGTLFVDYACSSGFSDMNTIIYGHHMKSGSMFASIVEYRSQEYYDVHPVMYLLTPDGNYRLEVFGGFVADSGTNRLFGLDEQQQFQDYLAQIKTQSDFKTDIEVTSQDRIVTLQTCTYEYEGARYQLFAVLSRIGDQPEL